jgi:hypothetical protein
MKPSVLLIVALSLGLSAPALAGPAADAPPPAPADNAAEAPQAPTMDNTAALSPVAPVDNTWVDRYHTYIEEDLYATVVWFDHFFADELRKDIGSTQSSLRWTNSFRWDQQQHFVYRTWVRASIRLPHLSGKWRLVISGENKGDPTAYKPEDPGNPGLAVTASDRRASTELVYDVLQTRNTAVDFGVGVRVKIPPDAYARTRLVHVEELGYGIIGRLTATPYWDAADGFGESNQIDFERPLSPQTLLRWGNSLTIAEGSGGWNWGTEVSFLQRLSKNSAITFAGSANGPTRPSFVAGNYRVFTRYRRNFKRDWLFFELEPDINWPRQQDGSRQAVWGGTFRLEVVFQGKELARQGGNATPGAWTREKTDAAP